MPSTPTPTLTEVAEAFAHWRRTKTHPHTPEALKQKTLQLLPHYRISQILKALNINHRTLTEWKKATPPTQKNATPTFLSLPPIDPNEPSKSSEERITLKLTQQTSEQHLSIEGQLSQAQWHWALKLLQIGATQ